MRKPIAIAVITLLSTAAFAAGEVYRWKDASGIWHYSDQPHAGAEVVHGGSAGTTPTAPATTTTPAAAPAAQQTTDPLPVSKEVAAEVRQDAATAKSKACEKAKTDYNDMISKQRLYRTDEKGTRIYLDAAEIDATRLQARAVRDLACAP